MEEKVESEVDKKVKEEEDEVEEEKKEDLFTLTVGSEMLYV